MRASMAFDVAAQAAHERLGIGSVQITNVALPKAELASAGTRNAEYSVIDIEQCAIIGCRLGNEAMASLRLVFPPDPGIAVPAHNTATFTRSCRRENDGCTI